MNRRPAFHRRRVGRWTVTALGDGTIVLPPSTITGFDPQQAARILQAAGRGPDLHVSVNAFLVEGDGRTFLIDTGAGAAALPGAGHLPASLAAAGTEPGAVDAILLTHLHSDHTGGLATGGTALFPRAELILSEAEARHWLGAGAPVRAPEAAQAAVRPYESRLRPIPGEAAICPGITAVPLPGHTPGHTGFLVADGGESLLIWGDIMHVPEIQAPHPEATVGFDTDPAQAAATRKRVLDWVSTDRIPVAGAHLHLPTFNHLARDGQGYRLIPETGSPVP